MKNRLKELREGKGYTQTKVAEDMYVDQTSISHYENGSREAGNHMLVRFADYYGVSIDYILGRTENPKVNQ